MKDPLKDPLKEWLEELSLRDPKASLWKRAAWEVLELGFLVVFVLGLMLADARDFLRGRFHGPPHP
jgi:hypothetical protein